MMEPDLNLLRVFDMLMEQRSVTRAAERLNLTQSAVSHALGRLRGVLDDPLFVRSPGGLPPTARAGGIAPTDNPVGHEPLEPARIAELPQVVIAVSRPIDAMPATEGQLARLFPRLLVDAERTPRDPIVSVYDSQTAIAVVARCRSVAR